MRRRGLLRGVSHLPLKLFVKRGLLDIETAQGMLNWPHSGFHVHDGVCAPADDREFTVRLARYCARNPIARGRMEYRQEDSSVTYHSDKPTGPTAGSETTDALEFLARLTSHIPNKGQVLQRYYGWYSSRQRGMRRKAAGPDEDSEKHPLITVEPEPEALRDRLHHPAHDDRPHPGPPASHTHLAKTAARSAQTLDGFIAGPHTWQGGKEFPIHVEGGDSASSDHECPRTDTSCPRSGLAACPLKHHC